MYLYYGLDHESKDVSMKNNTRYLIVIALVLALASYVVLQNKSTEIEVNTLLIPQLQDMVNDVDNIGIIQGNSSIHFYKEDGSWRIVELNSFFADTNKIAQLLLSLRAFRLKQAKTSQSKKYVILGLEGPQAINIILKKHGKVFADVYIGKQALKTQGTYVRKKSDKQSWLSTGQINVTLDKEEWIVKNIIDVGVQEVQSVSYQPINGHAFKIVKNISADESFIFEFPTKNDQIKPNVNSSTLANGLSKFIVNNIVSDVVLGKDDLVNSVSYTLFSGTVYQLNLYNQTGKNYVMITIENSESLTSVEKQLDKWVFSLPQFKFDALNKSSIDILENESATKEEK